MGEPEESDKKKPARDVEDADAATLAAIDEGISDAQDGHTISLEKWESD